MSAATTVPCPRPKPSCPAGSFACLQGHGLPALLLQGPEGAPRAHGHGEHEWGIKEATEQPGEPPQQPGVGTAS